MMIKKILKFLALPLTPLNKLIPKSKRLILIYSNLGFRDNARSIYEYMIEMGYNKKYKIVCSSEDYRLWKKSAPENVKFIPPRRALPKFLRCRWMLYSFGKFPIKPAKKQTVVNLWHGMPLKTVGALEKGVQFDGKCYFDYTIATSPFFSEVMQRCFNIGSEKVLLTGQPRCDKLLEKGSEPKKLILWLPTYRTSSRLRSSNSSFSGTGSFPLINSEEQLEELDALLGSIDFKLLIKPHPLQDISEGMKGLENVHFTTQRALDRRGMDIYDLMKKSCALITDYSSVYFDYLLLDRPIGFTLDDIITYGNDRGFVVDDPTEFMPGEKLRGFEDLKTFILGISEGKDSCREERERIGALVNSDQTGGASKRILDIIGVKM